MSSKYKIEIEIEIDFDKIFKEIEPGLYSGSEGCDEAYEKDVIYDAIKNTYLYALDKDMEDLVKDKQDNMYKYLKHHNKCLLEASKQISKNIKLTKL